MEFYTVEFWDGSRGELDKIFTNFDKAKEYVESEAEYLSDWYEVTKWALNDDEFQPVETTCYQEKSWLETNYLEIV